MRKNNLYKNRTKENINKQLEQDINELKGLCTEEEILQVEKVRDNFIKVVTRNFSGDDKISNESNRLKYASRLLSNMEKQIATQIVKGDNE